MVQTTLDSQCLSVTINTLSLSGETGKIERTIYEDGVSFMSITLTTEMEELVNERLSSGAFSSAEEVVLASLRLLKLQEEKLEALRREIEIGVEDGRNGRFTVYSTDDDIERLADEIIAEGRARQNQAGKP